ncbi:hypothetical protein HPP92_010283 [Vanilla planifolia]|uniref:Uncharacterized protein n=1 Tax=Vanilla planifolia TaxID=51239 RepID=A0A835V0N3_VANPL|nr:hypothetical protein HPP92_010283 [Vanilla planifolia]
MEVIDSLTETWEQSPVIISRFDDRLKEHQKLMEQRVIWEFSILNCLKEIDKLEQEIEHNKRKKREK